MTELAQRYAVELRERGSEALPILGACALSVVVGWRIGHDSTRLPLALSSFLALVLIGVRAFGVAAGILVVAAMNGLPFVDLESYSQSGSFRASDVAMVALIGALALRNRASVSDQRLNRWIVVSRWWAFALTSWWLLTLLRSNFFSDIPMLKAALFGRDFLYFALLLPLLLGGLHTLREIWQLLATLLAATVLFTLGHLALVVANVQQATWFVHESLTNDVGGVTRVYALMGDAAVAAGAFGIALTLMAPSARLRLAGVALAVPTAASVLLQFARATYFGLFLGLLSASAIWMARRATGPATRRLAIVFAGLALVGGIVLTTTSRSTSSTAYAVTPDQLPSAGSIPAPTIVASRFSSGVVDISTRSGTVGYRYELDKKLFHVLGDHWLTGLGFWHPDVRYVGSLPDGSIRNTDTGGMNSLMTMGVIGTVLIYLAPLGVLGAIFRQRRRIRPQAQWIFFGMFTWIVALLVGSISLVTLFSVSGIALTSVLLAATIRLLLEYQHD